MTQTTTMTGIPYIRNIPVRKYLNRFSQQILVRRAYTQIYNIIPTPRILDVQTFVL